MDIDSYIKGFEEVYDMIKLDCPILEMEDVILPEKEKAFAKALSRYLCTDMVNQIIPTTRPKTLKIFSGKKDCAEAFIDFIDHNRRTSFLAELSHSGLIRSVGDVILGVYSSGSPKVYLEPQHVQIRLIKTHTETSHGTFYAFPVPLLSRNLIRTSIKCEEVESTLCFYEIDVDRLGSCVMGYFPELTYDKSLVLTLTPGRITVRRLEEGYACVGRREIKKIK